MHWNFSWYLFESKYGICLNFVWYLFESKYGICLNFGWYLFESKYANDRMTVAGVHHSALTDSSLPCSPIILLPTNDGSNLWIDHPFSFVFQHANICAVFGSLVFQEAPVYLSSFNQDSLICYMFCHSPILTSCSACHYPYEEVDYKGQFKQIGFQLWHLFHLFVLSSPPIEQWRVGSITVYIFIASQIELKIETAVSQKLNFTPRGRLLNFPIQIWERERPVRQKICISNWHWLSVFIINWVLNETVF